MAKIRRSTGLSIADTTQLEFQKSLYDCDQLSDKDRLSSIVGAVDC